MSLAPLNTLVLGTRRRSSMGSPKIFNLPKMTFIQVSLATGNGMARKVLICDNLISPDRGAFSHPFCNGSSPTLRAGHSSVSTWMIHALDAFAGAPLNSFRIHQER